MNNGFSLRSFRKGIMRSAIRKLNGYKCRLQFFMWKHDIQATTK